MRGVQLRLIEGIAPAAGMAAGGAAERTAKATEETARNTKKLVNKASQGGPTFG